MPLRDDQITVPGSIVIIGGGRMGEAILGGLLSAGSMSVDAVTVVEPDAERCGVLNARYGVRATMDATDALDGADIALLAVKPQVLETVVIELSELLSRVLVISIAAGISCARIESLLRPGAAVVRVMPNTPALVGSGVALISGGTEASEADLVRVDAIFSAIGESVRLDERYQDAGTAISGSGPAYFALVVDALARAGVAQGLSRPVAQDLAVKTMLGTAKLLVETDSHPAEVIDAVASPGGTTIAALERLEAGGVRAAFAEAVEAAVRRSRELGA